MSEEKFNDKLGRLEKSLNRDYEWFTDRKELWQEELTNLGVMFENEPENNHSTKSKITKMKNLLYSTSKYTASFFEPPGWYMSDLVSDSTKKIRELSVKVQTLNTKLDQLLNTNLENSTEKTHIQEEIKQTKLKICYANIAVAKKCDVLFNKIEAEIAYVAMPARLVDTVINGVLLFALQAKLPISNFTVAIDNYLRKPLFNLIYKPLNKVIEKLTPIKVIVKKSQKALGVEDPKPKMDNNKEQKQNDIFKDRPFLSLALFKERTTGKLIENGQANPGLAAKC